MRYFITTINTCEILLERLTDLGSEVVCTDSYWLVNDKHWASLHCTAIHQHVLHRKTSVARSCSTTLFHFWEKKPTHHRLENTHFLTTESGQRGCTTCRLCSQNRNVCFYTCLKVRTRRKWKRLTRGSLCDFKRCKDVASSLSPLFPVLLCLLSSTRSSSLCNRLPPPLPLSSARDFTRRPVRSPWARMNKTCKSGEN